MWNVSSVVLSEEEHDVAEFVIELDLSRKGAIHLAISSVEDMQLWLEALQLSMQRGRVLESLSFAAKSLHAGDELLKLGENENVKSVFGAVRSGTTDEIMAKFQETRQRHSNSVPGMTSSSNDVDAGEEQSGEGSDHHRKAHPPSSAPLGGCSSTSHLETSSFIFIRHINVCCVD